MSASHEVQEPPQKALLEREIEVTREELVHTVDAIVDRLAPPRVAARTTEQARRSAHRAAAGARGWAIAEPARTAALVGAATALLSWLLWEAVRPKPQDLRTASVPPPTSRRSPGRP